MKTNNLLPILVLIFLFGINKTSAQCTNVSLNSQTAVNEFIADFSTCAHISGNFTIMGSDITDISGLSFLQTIGGNLVITSNSSLSSLSGLQKLTTINGNLVINDNDLISSLSVFNNLVNPVNNLIISRNDNLPNLMGFNNLTSVNGYLMVQQNHLLTSLLGFPQLASIGTDLIVTENNGLTSLNGLNSLMQIQRNITIQYNPLITNLSGLETISSIAGDFTLTSNSQLQNVDGLQNFTNIGGNFIFSYNTLLNSLDALSNLSQIGGTLEIGNTALTDLSGLTSLTQIGQNLSLLSNANLLNLNGLDGLSNIGNNLILMANSSLESLETLIQLEHLGGNFLIQGNSSLQNLDGLQNIESLNMALNLVNNASLIDISALANVNLNTLNNIGSLPEINIQNNPNLSTCAIESVCSALFLDEIEAVIAGNSTNCNSVSEVENACATFWDQDSDGYNYDVDCNDLDATIYPGAPEIANDGIDQDCDGEDLIEIATCAIPTNVDWDVTPTSITAWCDSSAEHLGYDLETTARPSRRFTPTGVPNWNDVSMPFTVNGLAPNYTYSFMLRADCSGDDSNVSEWVGPFEFRTLAIDARESAVAVVQITPNPATDLVTILGEYKGEKMKFSKVEIYTSDGSFVAGFELHGNQFSVKALQTGRYAIQIMDSNGNIYSEKLIKK